MKKEFTYIIIILILSTFILSAQSNKEEEPNYITFLDSLEFSVDKKIYFSKLDSLKRVYPDSPHLKKKYAEYYLFYSKDFQKADSLFSELITIHSSPEVFIEYAELKGKLDRKEAQDSLYTEALKKYKNNERILSYYLDFLERNSMDKRREEIIRKYSQKQIYKKKFETILKVINQNRPYKALKLIEKALKDSTIPDNKRMLLILDRMNLEESLSGKLHFFSNFTKTKSHYWNNENFDVTAAWSKRISDYFYNEILLSHQSEFEKYKDENFEFKTEDNLFLLINDLTYVVSSDIYFSTRISYEPDLKTVLFYSINFQLNKEKTFTDWEVNLSFSNEKLNYKKMNSKDKLAFKAKLKSTNWTTNLNFDYSVVKDNKYYKSNTLIKNSNYGYQGYLQIKNHVFTNPNLDLGVFCDYEKNKHNSIYYYSPAEDIDYGVKFSLAKVLSSSLNSKLTSTGAMNKEYDFNYSSSILFNLKLSMLNMSLNFSYNHKPDQKDYSAYLYLSQLNLF